MHLVDDTKAVPVRSTSDLVQYFASAGKPPSAWRAGTEHELIGVIDTPGAQEFQAPPYAGPNGIGKLLDWFSLRGGTAIREDGHTIALSRRDEQLTIEPGGQFELAARPVSDDATFVSDLRSYLGELQTASRELGLSWLLCGLRPFGTRDDIPWMPKQRYAVMRDYMPRVGTRGLDMMLRTATVQVNLDFADESNAAAKLRCLYSVTSLLTALWACSPIVEDRPSGFQSYRAWIWRDTDRARCGILPFVFERDDVFTAYTEWALDIPMYFVHRGSYLAVPGDLTFRRFLEHGWNGHTATEADWALHLSTLFPEGRLKKFIEVRGCDCGSIEMITALAPMMRGLLDDPTARDEATALTAALSITDRQQLADDVPRLGLRAKAGSHSVGVLARELVAIAKHGLARVAPTSLPLLDPVEAIASSGITQADRMLELWQRHPGDRAALVRALSFTTE
ncbi:MAG: glutamate--cysteine ligase [Kofleriaceae bacterium]